MKSENFISHRTPRSFYNKLGQLYLTEAEVLADPDIQKKMGPSLLKKQTSVFDKYSETTPSPKPMKYQVSSNT